MSSLLSRNQTLAIAVKKHAKVEIKLFLISPILLYFSTLFHIFQKVVFTAIYIPFFYLLTYKGISVYFLHAPLFLCHGDTFDLSSRVDLGKDWGKTGQKRMMRRAYEGRQKFLRGQEDPKNTMTLSTGKTSGYT